MTDAATICIRPLAPALLADYLAFFDAKAFPDNPRWGFCYCYFPYHDPEKIDWNKRAGPENRAAISARILDGTAHGYLAGFAVVEEDAEGHAFVRKSLA
jgi:hypothetical protein